AGAFLDARRHVDIEDALLLHQAAAAAALAGIADDLAGATARSAGALDGEETLGGAHLAVTRTGGAGLRAVAGFRARTAARLAADHGGHLDLGVAAGEGFFQSDVEIVAQVLAAFLPLAPAHAAHHLAEQIFEHIAEAAGEIAEGAAGTATPALEGGMTEAVIGGALLIVLQNVIGFVDFLEFDFGSVVVGILVGMKPHRQLAVGRFQRLDRRGLLAFQGFVITALCSHSPRTLPAPGKQRPFALSREGPGCFRPRLSCCRRLPRSRRQRHCHPAWARCRRHRRPHQRTPLRTAGPCTWPRPASWKPGPGCWSFP